MFAKIYSAESGKPLKYIKREAAKIYSAESGKPLSGKPLNDLQDSGKPLSGKPLNDLQDRAESR